MSSVLFDVEDITHVGKTGNNKNYMGMEGAMGHDERSGFLVNGSESEGGLIGG